jgi:hypothetical protein
VTEKLKSLHDDGFKVVIFTNQGGIEKNKQKKSDITGKITDLAKEVSTTLFLRCLPDSWAFPYKHLLPVRRIITGNPSLLCGITWSSTTMATLSPVCF